MLMKCVGAAWNLVTVMLMRCVEAAWSVVTVMRMSLVSHTKAFQELTHFSSSSFSLPPAGEGCGEEAVKF